MSRFFSAPQENGEIGYYFTPEEDDEFLIELNENSYLANIHQTEPQFDRVAVEDSRDELWFQFWRYDQDPEMFKKLSDLAMDIGSVLLRQTATQEIKDLFYNGHQFTDDDFEHLLEEPKDETE